MSGPFLHAQLIYERTTNRFLPKGVDFAADFDATCTESKSIQHLEEIVLPFFEEKKIVLWIKRQCSNLMLQRKNNFVMIYVSNKLTDQFQPLELEVRS